MLILILAILIVFRGLYCYVKKKKFFNSVYFTMPAALLISIIVIGMCDQMIYANKSEEWQEKILKASTDRNQAEYEISYLVALYEDGVLEEEICSNLMELEMNKLRSAEDTIETIRQENNVKSNMRYLIYFGE